MTTSKLIFGWILLMSTGSMAAPADGSISSSGFAFQRATLRCESPKGSEGPRYRLTVFSYDNDQLSALVLVDADDRNSPLLVNESKVDIKLTSLEFMPYLSVTAGGVSMMMPVSPAKGELATFKAELNGKTLEGQLSCTWSDF